MARLSYSVSREALNFYKGTKIIEIVNEFINSGADIAEFLYGEGEYSNVNTARSTIDQNLKHRHLTNTVGTAVRKGHLYLVRKDIDNA